MSKLEIRQRSEDCAVLGIQDVKVLLDGQELTGLAGLKLVLTDSGLPHAVLTIVPRSVKVDADILNYLEASVSR